MRPLTPCLRGTRLRTAASANTSSVGPDAITRAEVEHEHALDERCGPARRRARRAGSRIPCSRCTSRSVARELVGLGAVETRRRLVEQQQLGLGHQRAADLDEPADAEAQRLDLPVGDRRRARAARASLGRALLLGRVGPTAPERVLPAIRRGRCGPGRRRGSARAATCPRTARCAGTCGRCRAAPAGASARASGPCRRR